MNTTPSFRAEAGSAVGLCIRIVLLFMSGELQGAGRMAEEGGTVIIGDIQDDKGQQSADRSADPVPRLRRRLVRHRRRVRGRRWLHGRIRQFRLKQFQARGPGGSARFFSAWQRTCRGGSLPDEPLDLTVERRPGYLPHVGVNMRTFSREEVRGRQAETAELSVGPLTRI